METAVLWSTDLDWQGNAQPLQLEKLVAELLTDEFENPFLLGDYMLIDADDSTFGHFFPLSG